VVEEVLVERLHPVVGALLDDLGQATGLRRVHDHVAHAAGHAQDLAAGDPPAAVGRGHEALRHRALQRAGDHRPHLLVHVRREEVDQAVDGLGGVDGVDRREDEVTGLRRAERGMHGLLVAHLADQDDVRVLAQDAAQRALERAGVHADLALVDDRLLVLVQELDRVLDRHDVPGPRRVDVVDHRGQRRRLARAGGAGEQHDAALLLGQLADDGRQLELVDRPDVDRDRADDERHRPALAEGVDAEARDARDRVGEVDLVLLLELTELVGVVEHLVDRAERVLAGERGGALEAAHGAVDAHDRRSGDLEVQVGAAGLDEAAEAVVEIEGHAQRIGRAVRALDGGWTERRRAPDCGARATVGLGCPVRAGRGATRRRAASAPPPATAASSATGSRSGGCARA
jgi:hypothetical protein